MAPRTYIVYEAPCYEHLWRSCCDYKLKTKEAELSLNLYRSCNSCEGEYYDSMQKFTCLIE